MARHRPRRVPRVADDPAADHARHREHPRRSGPHHRAATLKLNADDPDLYRVRDVLDALKHIHDHKPATATEASAWLRDVHGLDVPRATVIKWGQRYPETIERDDGGKYVRAGILTIARRLLVGHRADAA
jgi:hypothetical protein